MDILLDAWLVCEQQQRLAIAIPDMHSMKRKRAADLLHDVAECEMQRLVRFETVLDDSVVLNVANYGKTMLAIARGDRMRQIHAAIAAQK